MTIEKNINYENFDELTKKISSIFTITKPPSRNMVRKIDAVGMIICLAKGELQVIVVANIYQLRSLQIYTLPEPFELLKM